MLQQVGVPVYIGLKRGQADQEQVLLDAYRQARDRRSPAPFFILRTQKADILHRMRIPGGAGGGEGKFDGVGRKER